MKFVAFFTVFLICVNLSLQIDQLVNCPPDFVATENGCGRTTCHGPGQFGRVICPLSRCAPGKQIRYQEEDVSKVFPECCGRPICRH